jgi:hypothetical protein
LHLSPAHGWSLGDCGVSHRANICEPGHCRDTSCEFCGNPGLPAAAHRRQDFVGIEPCVHRSFGEAAPCIRTTTDLPPDFRTTDKLRDWLPIRKRCSQATALSSGVWT